MTNTFIRLSGKHGENRGSVMAQVHTSLSITYGREKDILCNYILHNDLIATFRINGQRVGLISHQNPSQDMDELIDQLIQLSCKVILFTTVNAGSASETFNSMLRQNNYKTINLLPFWSQAMEFDYLAQVEVENVIELVEMLTDNSGGQSIDNESPQIVSRKKAMNAPVNSLNI